MAALPDAEILRRMAFDNPWWEDRDALLRPFGEWPRRAYFDPFLQLVSGHAHRAVVLMGPRRVGKTVMLQQAVHALVSDGVEPSTILFVSLDTPVYLDLDLEQLVLRFRQRFGHDRHDRLFVFFDEVQYHRNWEVHLKSLVDSYPQIRFVASGSAAAALRLKSHESGAGRFTDFALPPLTFAEYLRFGGTEATLIEPEPGPSAIPWRATDIDQLNRQFVDYINVGGFPEAVLDPSIRADPTRFIRHDVIDKVLLRDIPSLYGISDTLELYRLFTTLAWRTGQELSIEKLATSSNVSKETLRRYIEYLEAAFLVRRLDRVNASGARFRRARTFRVCLVNPSMRAALFGPMAPRDPTLGPVVETALIAQWHHSELGRALWYARWKEGRSWLEVDLVSCGGPLQAVNWAVEVKWTDRFVDHPADLKGLLRFADVHGLGEGRNDWTDLVCTTLGASRSVSVSGRVLTFVPTALLAYQVGRSIIEQKLPLRP